MVSRGSAAAATYGPDEDGLIASAADTIRRTVAALAIYRDATAEDIAQALRISRATAYRKLNGKSEYTAAELWPLSHLLGCDVRDFYSGILSRPETRPGAPDRQIFNDPGIADLHARRARQEVADRARGARVTEVDTRRYPPATSSRPPALTLVTAAPADYRAVARRNRSSATGSAHTQAPHGGVSTKAVNLAHPA